jgi:hypothetical protein
MAAMDCFKMATGKIAWQENIFFATKSFTYSSAFAQTEDTFIGAKKCEKVVSNSVE